MYSLSTDSASNYVYSEQIYNQLGRVSAHLTSEVVQNRGWSVLATVVRYRAEHLLLLSEAKAKRRRMLFSVFVAWSPLCLMTQIFP